MLAKDAIMSMPPWVYWLQGRDAMAAALQSPATWEGEPRAGRYPLVAAPMNGQPAALAYVRNHRGRHTAVCLTVLTLAAESRISEMTVFIVPALFKARGFPVTLE